MVMALDEHGPIAGMASALGGTLQMLAGGVMIVVASVFFDGTVLPMVTLMTLCALGSAVLAVAILQRRGRETVPEPAE
jgi:DHA1 family bicyclomycin/chloramphenicol resistance-like MFS transporter